MIDDGPNGAYDSKAFREAMEGTARRPGTIFRDVGDFAGALASVDEKVEAEVTVPHLAPAAMESPSVTARIVDGKAEVWTSVHSRRPRTIWWRKFLALRPKTSPSN